MESPMSYFEIHINANISLTLVVPNDDNNVVYITWLSRDDESVSIPYMVTINHNED